MPVRVVVDSTSDIPRERAQQLGIEVAPLLVLFGDDEYRDGIDLTGEEFYQKLSSSPVSPTTSAPSVGSFQEAYRKVISEGADAILEISLAAKLSATYGNAVTAAKTVSAETGVPIEVIDSGTVSGGVGMPAEIVAYEARQGATLEQLKAHAQDMLSRVRLYAALDTLEYLKRGGRIGNARALLGSLLNVKPLVEVREGQVLPVENVRTRSKAQERVGQIASTTGELEAVAVVRSNDAVGEQFDRIVRGFWDGPIYKYVLGPVVGTHAGPGAGGIIVITKNKA
ncbi:MAG TPA: DegV family protein [Ktedonobacterales bacterium]